MTVCWRCSKGIRGQPAFWGIPNRDGDISNHAVHYQCWLELRRKHLGLTKAPGAE